MARFLSSDFLVRPLETVYFGPPQSFSAGENHRGRSEFPPTPTTFQGLVRSQLLRAVEPPLDLDDWSSAARAERAALVGEPDTLPGGWQLQGPFPAQTVPPPGPEEWEEPWTIPWISAPRFLLRHSGADRSAPLHAQPVRSSHPGLNDLGTQGYLLGRPGDQAFGSLDGWIGPDNLAYALTGRGTWRPEQYAPVLPPFVCRELRPGVAIDRANGTAQHAMLYFLNSLRFAPDAGLLGRFFGRVDERVPAEALETGTGLAGRKGRPAAFQRIARLHPTWRSLLEGQHLPTTVGESDGFWLVALTPARIAHSLAPVIRAALPSEVRVRTLAALTGPPQVIGGYAMAGGYSRPNRAYIPAGSAWWIALEGGDAARRAEVLRLLNNAHVLGEPEEAPFGYGHTLVGLGPETQEKIP